MRPPRRSADRRTASAEMRDEYAARRRLVLTTLADIPGVRVLAPEGGFFAMVDVRADRRAVERDAPAAAQRHGVVVVHGAAYGRGGEGTLRVSFASGGDTLARGLDAAARRARARYDHSCRSSRHRPATGADLRSLNLAGLRRALAPNSRARCVSTRSRARSTPPTPASTRSSRSASSSRDRARMSFGSFTICARVPLPAHHARRRHVAGRPGDRRRAVSSTPRSTSTASSR